MISMTDVPSPPAAWQDDAVLWQYRPFCGLALPLRAPRSGSWSRVAGGTGIAMGAEAADDAPPLPAGILLRLLLLHIFTAALCGGSAAAGIGPDAAAVAARFRLAMPPPKLRDLDAQAERLIVARLRVAEANEAPFSVLDARRSGHRGGRSAWRPVLHLSGRFFASLQQNAVALNRDTVTALAGSAPALDAYAWLAATLPEIAADQHRLVSWDELQQRFGQGRTLNRRAFETAFTESLETIRAIHPAVRFTIGANGVELHGPVAMAAAQPSAAAPRAAAEPEQHTPPALPERMADPAAPQPEPPPGPMPVQVSTPSAGREPRPSPEWERNGGRIRLAPMLTGLTLSVWLRRGGDEGGATIEVTPDAEYNPARRSLLMLEPMILQVSGYLQPAELDQIAAWAMANADLIQDYWDGSIATIFDVAGRVRPVPALR